MATGLSTVSSGNRADFVTVPPAPAEFTAIRSQLRADCEKPATVRSPALGRWWQIARVNGRSGNDNACTAEGSR